MRMSICPLPSVGAVGKGLGQEPGGTHIQYDVVLGETINCGEVPTINCRVKTVRWR